MYRYLRPQDAGVCVFCQDEAEAARQAGVYLLHYQRPHPNGRHPRHYLGHSPDIARRVAQHASGTSGARLPAVMRELGIAFEVARTWPGGDKPLERRLKGWKKARLLCPLCAAAAVAAPGEQLALALPVWVGVA